MSAQSDYWEECVAIAAEECDAKLTLEQIAYISGSVESGHENYGMAFYSPPASDRMADIERDWKRKLADLQAEFDRYRGSAETAVRRALRQRHDESVSINEHGEVFRHGGRTEQIL